MACISLLFHMKKKLILIVKFNFLYLFTYNIMGNGHFIIGSLASKFSVTICCALYSCSYLIMNSRYCSIEQVLIQVIFFLLLFQHDKGVQCAPYGSSQVDANKGNYIMYASATSGDKVHNSMFSPCSKDNITRVLDAVVNRRNGKDNCFVCK